MIGAKLMPEWLQRFSKALEGQKVAKQEREKVVQSIKQSANEMREAGEELRLVLKGAVCKNENVRNGR